MSEIENRLADVERRLQRLELAARPPYQMEVAEPVPPQTSRQVMIRNLLFWIGLIVLGLVIWNFSSNLAESAKPR